ncbi:hypothetical protein VTJ49DRAFT_4898 [Mycothermus thermophilus]|uniref:Uncharacterized protein n=1 Tax=Humicola insolens TaxID=85995 RepID=A0ABR3V489_HUMIN
MATIREAAEADMALHGRPFATTVRRSFARMLLRREDECHPQPGIDLCEKPSVSSVQTTWIIVGTVLGLLLVVTGSVLIFLHIRKTKRDKREDVEDRFHRADYGLDDLPSSRKPPADDDMTDSSSAMGYGNRPRSRDPLQGGAEPKYQNGQNGGGRGRQLNPFDDTSSLGSIMVYGYRYHIGDFALITQALDLLAKKFRCEFVMKLL